ncbi:MAG: polymer-forming cytoskeletal protein [Pseudomonadales bacterium]
MIGPSIIIKGEVLGDEDLVILGKVEGIINLHSNEISIGESGKVTADIIGKVIKIDGEVIGDITGNEKVVISKSGNVRGNIIAPRVTLEDGAIFKGSIDMDPGENASKMVSLASQKAAAPASGNQGSGNQGNNNQGNKAPGLDLKRG